MYVCLCVLFLLKTIRERGSHKHGKLQYNIFHGRKKHNKRNEAQKNIEEKIASSAREQHWNHFIGGYICVCVCVCNDPIFCAFLLP